jgi:hypothetical protein
MAIKMLDSFDHYATSDIERKWTQLYPQSGDPASTTIASGTGRRGSNSLRMSIASSGVGTCEPISRFFPSTATVCVVGFAFKATGAGAFVTNTAGTYLMPWAGLTSLNPHGRNWLLNIRSGNRGQIIFTLEDNGTIMAWRGENPGSTEPGTVWLGTTSEALEPNQWYYLEFKVLIHNSAGTVDVRINGVNRLSLSGADTYWNPEPAGYYPIPAVGWDEVVIGHLTCGAGFVIGQYAGIVTWDFDDLYIADGTSTATNDVVDFWGDHRIDARRITADGATLQMSPLGAGDHYVEVDDLVPDDDTTYNTEDTAGHIDTFVVENAAVAGYVVDAVQVLNLSKRSQEGDSTTKPVLRSAGTNYSGAAKGNNTTYSYGWDIWTKDPADNTTILDTEWNAMEVGVEKDA